MRHITSVKEADATGSDFAYKGYLCSWHNINGQYSIWKDGYFICWAKNRVAALESINLLTD
jgi:hypothetical protein